MAGDDYLTDKVIVITGASSGFGRGMALRFAPGKPCLVLAARRENLLEDLVQECTQLGARAIAVPMDVSETESMAMLLQTAVSTFGRVDVWINNAGVAVLGPFLDAPLADHLRLIEVNLVGMMQGSYMALQHFKQQGSGHLINFASTFGLIPSPYYASYVATKFGVVGFSRAIQQELKQMDIKDIHLSTIFPMANDTPFFEHAANYTGHQGKPMPPVYDPKDVIEAVANTIKHPKEEVVVGFMNKLMAFMHSIAPGLTERISAYNTHTTQMVAADPAPPTDGNLYTPVQEGAGIRGTPEERRQNIPT